MIHFYHSFYGEFTKVHYINSVCENFYNNIVISIHLKISTLFVVSPFLIAKVSPEGKPGFQGPEKLSLFLK